ncbi:MAG: T9SS type A sorting domain-containing protein [Bacteroidetes bacterium]|nr:T9SS type A sorting domain-containing protein [Bacteroidota bacterium]
MKKCLICFMFFTLPFVFSGQINPEAKRANHWYFGYKAGIDFSSGVPVVDTSSQMYMQETGSTISDENGNLLFYTNGDTIWNKNHLIMANGTGLINCKSSSQGGLIVRKPSSLNLFYIFTNDCEENNCMSGVHYSIIDMNLNAGLGAVTVKNVLLYAPSTEKLTSVYHCNNNDIWIVGQTRNSNQFRCYLLTSLGINTTPVLTNIGYIHNDDTTPAVGVIDFSPDKQKLAVVYSIYNPHGIEELYDFDASTGLISNLLVLPPDTSEYGVAFSSDSQKLYIGSGGGGGIANKIYQYDLSSNSSSTIISSKTLILYSTSNWPTIDLQNGSDGKIYGTRFCLDSVSVINNPNLSGSACNYNNAALSLKTGICHENFPRYSESIFSTTTLTDSATCATGIKNELLNGEITVFPNPTIDYFYVNNNGIENIFINIKDLFGNNIYANNYTEVNFRVDVRDLKKGIYIVNIKSGNKQQTIKLIKS